MDDNTNDNGTGLDTMDATAGDRFGSILGDLSTFIRTTVPAFVGKNAPFDQSQTSPNRPVNFSANQVSINTGVLFLVGIIVAGGLLFHFAEKK